MLYCGSIAPSVYDVDWSFPEIDDQGIFAKPQAGWYVLSINSFCPGSPPTVYFDAERKTFKTLPSCDKRCNLS